MGNNLIQLISILLLIGVTHSQQNLQAQTDLQSTYDDSSSIIFNFIFGPVLFAFAFPVIWFNEKKSAIDSRTLHQAQLLAVEINPYSPAGGSGTQELVYMTGQSINNTPLIDLRTGVTANNALKLNRKVEVMEWRSSRSKNNVTYNLKWVDKHEHQVSGRFNDPSSWFIYSETIYAQAAELGSYILAQCQLQLCTKSIIIPPTQNEVYKMQQEFPELNRVITIHDSYIYFSKKGILEEQGTTRIQFSYCPVGPISIFAERSNQLNSFKPFPIAEYIQNKTGRNIMTNHIPKCCCCALSEGAAELLKPIFQINIVEEEKLSRHQLMEKTLWKARLQATIVRFVAYIFMALGLYLFFTPITAILGYIPFLGGLIESIANILIFVAALIICLPLTLLTLSIAWSYYHPRIGIPILLLAVAGIITLIVLEIIYRPI